MGPSQAAPAPAGTYLVGLATTDLACNTGRFPIVLPPSPGSTPARRSDGSLSRGTAVARYRSRPARPRSSTSTRAPGLLVDARPVRGAQAAPQGPRRRPGAPLDVKLPPKRPGLYVLAAQLRAVPHGGAARRKRATVGRAPADPGRAAGAHLAGREPRRRRRRRAGEYARRGRPDPARPPLRRRPPGRARRRGGARRRTPDKANLGYDLTTDVALIGGVGPPLTAYKAVVFAGSERGCRPRSSAPLQSYVQHGGHVLSLGIDSLRGRVPIQNTSQVPRRSRRPRRCRRTCSAPARRAPSSVPAP